MDKSEVISAIRDAFSEEKYPGDRRIMYDDRLHPDPECRIIRKELRGKKWQELDQQGLMCNHSSSFHFFSSMGYRYYLPAYLITALEHNASLLCDNIVWSLKCPPVSSDEYGRFQDRHSALKKRQKESVRMFLAYMKNSAKEPDQRKDALLALDSYWGQFAT